MNDETLFLAKIQQVLNLLNEIDDIIDNLPEKQQNVDWEISDYLHLLESRGDELTKDAKLSIDDSLARCRTLRRRLLNIFEISKVYNTNKNKLIYKNQREFLSNQIQATMKKLNNDYKYRVLDDKTIDDIINTKTESTEENNETVKKTRGRRACISKEDLLEKLKQGMNLTDIAKELNVTIGNISALKRRYGITKDMYKGA